MNYTKVTLGELVSSQDEFVRRSAMAILKHIQRLDIKQLKVRSEFVETKFVVEKRYCTRCGYVEAQSGKNCKECGSELIYKI